MAISDIVTFSRASSGTYFDANGVMQTAGNNVMRLDHDPVTKQPLGVLIEEQRTNLLLQSEDLRSEAGWTTTRSTVSAAGSTRGMSLWRMVPNTDAATSHQLTRNVNFSALAADTVYSVQLVAKADGATTSRIAFRFADTLGFLVYVYVDLLTGQFISGQGASSITRAVIVPLGEGFYRVELSYVVRATSTYATIQVFAASPEAIAVTSYDFNGTDGYILSSPQIEQGLFPTSYIPTTTEAATRAADIATTPTAPWLSQTDQATFVIDSTPMDFSGSTANDRRHLFSLAAGSGSDNLLYAFWTPDASGNLATFAVVTRRDGGTLKTRTVPSAQRYAPGRHRIAVAFLGTTMRVSIDGGEVVAVPDVDPRFSAMDLMRIGQQTATNPRYLNGRLRSLQHYPRALSDVELQAATVLS